jgi:hypothetical protein
MPSGLRPATNRSVAVGFPVVGVAGGAAPANAYSAIDRAVGAVIRSHESHCSGRSALEYLFNNLLQTQENENITFAFS